MHDGSGEAAAQEAALVDALGRAREERAAARALDQEATAAAQAIWTGLRRLALPAYLAREERRARPRGRVLWLSQLPAHVGGQVPEWRHEQWVGGVSRLALAVDPPCTLRCPITLDEPAELRGWLALRPEAWERFADPVELVVRVEAGGGVEAEQRVQIQPGVRLIDRRWVPWCVELPATGQAAELVLETRAPRGVADAAWTLLGAPYLEFGRPAAPRPPRRRQHRRRAPLIAILMPVHDPPLALLERTLASVLAQQHDGWELCICDDGSRNPAVRERLRELAASEPRVRLARHEEAGGISAATMRALALTTAPYVATLDHDDLLHPDAIGTVADLLARDPSIDVLYTDNDLVAGEDDRTFSAALKPGWSPDLQRAVMYTLHLGVYRRALVEAVGGWRSAFDGAQDHDLVLRLSERTDRIAHVPRVLAHWRAHAGSAALGELAKPAAYERGREAVAEHLARLGVQATVERLPWAGRYRVVHERTRPVIAFVPPGQPELEAAWRSALRPGDELRFLPPGGRDPGDPGRGVELAAPSGTTLLLAEAAAAPAGREAVDELAGHVEAGAAAAGGLIIDAAGRVVTGPLAFPEGLPVGLHARADAEAPDRPVSLTVASNRVAVRGVVAVPSGARPSCPVRSDGSLDLTAMSLALFDGGGRIVFTPHARFTAGDAAAADLWRPSLAEARALDRGGAADPYWNPQRTPQLADETYDESLHEAAG